MKRKLASALMALAMAGSLMISISAFAEMRYDDDMPDNDMDAASEEICHKARAVADAEVLEGYVHIRSRHWDTMPPRQGALFRGTFFLISTAAISSMPV